MSTDVHALENADTHSRCMGEGGSLYELEQDLHMCSSLDPHSVPSLILLANVCVEVTSTSALALGC